MSAPEQRRIVELLLRLAPVEGYNLTALPDVRFLRCNRPLRNVPVLYDPGIVIVCQGRKRGYFGGQLFLYDARHFLVVSVPVPFSMETDATPAEPMLAIYLRLDFNVAADLLVQLAPQVANEQVQPRSMLSTPMDEKLSQSVLRFLETMSSPEEARILGPQLVREIYFRILIGEQGPVLRAALTHRGPFGRISTAIRHIHGNFARKLTVSRLAAAAHMSVPAFHAHFKSVTHTSPMQYLKSTRLHQARLLMVRSDITAAEAARRVAYESPTQFSREFKRLFGLSPAKEADRMRRSFAVPPPPAGARYVSSH